MGFNVSEDDFSKYGPTYLKAVDWNNPNHRRAIAASLVMSVYVQDNDLQANRQGVRALAPPWWQFFGFKQLEPIDEKDNSTYVPTRSIVGAVFEYDKLSPQVAYHTNVNSAPKSVIAYRGTVMTNSLDLWADLAIGFKEIHLTSRCEKAIQIVSEKISSVGANNIWLTGHSLGSSIALVVGRNMVMKGTQIDQTYLFNPPFPHHLNEWIKNPYFNHFVRFSNDLIKVGVRKVKNILSEKKIDDDPFLKLTSWFPYLFVNENDIICFEYKGYFRHRQVMAKIKAKDIENIAARTSTTGTLLRAIGSQTEPIHLLPCAHLVTNKFNPKSLIKSHELNQWWKQNMQVMEETHNFRDFQ